MIEEHVLSQQERRKRALALRRRGPAMKIKREIAARHLASETTLERRAKHEARDRFRVRVAGLRGKNYASLTPAEKIEIDRLIDGKSSAIVKLAKRLIPNVRKAERDRFAALQNRKIQDGAGSDQSLKEYVDFAVSLVDEVQIAK